MCGIAGIIDNENKRLASVKKMIEALHHRGPDDRGLYLDESSGVALGQSRLSIIDLSGGHQPMVSDDGRYGLVFNGEIYNYIELAEELKKKGHTLKTGGDTEVLLHMYMEYGKDALEHLNGMFAFAIYDKQQRKLFAARDRIGIKPFYFYQDEKIFAFASEIPAFSEVEGLKDKLTINKNSLWHYFSLLYIPQPLTIYNELKVLPAGHFLEYQDGQLNEEKYWEFRIDVDRSKSEEEFLQELTELIESAVKLRMRSDVPYGAYLSGGVDSSLIVSKMAEIQNEPIKTFTARVRSSELDELEYALEISEKFNTDQKVIDVDRIDFDLLIRLVAQFGQPFADSSILPTYLISKKIREYVTVVLGGDGGDELFSGYDKYFGIIENNSNESVLDSFINRVPNGVKEQLFKKGFKVDLEQDTREFLLSNKGNYDYHGHDLLRFLDIEYFLKGDILTKVDQMSMANSLEARVPLLDYRIIELALKMPPEYLVSEIRNKIALKKILEKIMPTDFVNRQKVGFMLPIGKWLKKHADEILHMPIPQESQQWLNTQYLEKIIQDYKNGHEEYGNILFAYMVFSFWAKENHLC